MKTPYLNSRVSHVCFDRKSTFLMYKLLIYILKLLNTNQLMQILLVRKTTSIRCATLLLGFLTFYNK
ncbi:hypothetical protein FHR29_002860 [Sphingobacterium sp. JUb56]|nr:hypothetical protein [Sphingobacterium sp. JUb56]